MKTNYLNWLQENNYSTTSIITYEKIIKKYGQELTLTTESLVVFIKGLVKRLEPATCQLYTVALLSYAKFQKIKDIEWERIYDLIPDKVKKFYTTINEKELELLKSVRFEKSEAIHQRNNLILDFLFYSGLRVSELVNIKHRDWQNNSLRVHGKGNKDRFVFIPDFLVQYFQPQLTGYLFTRWKGLKITTDHVREIIKQRLKLAGVNKWITPHTFRRSLATNLYKQGGRLETIQKQLGHSSTDMTMNYIHNDHSTLYQDYSKLFQEKSSQNQSLKTYSTAELLTEINRRVGGHHA
ncbi:tyrosine-type recombinase/integrase [endosymbiont GvMRE of Glomus versiforme]|uniref:tyrosine-type recombinase/integrase n=1 Tax=endosymbiont GvMRE of Glomus versiforme TaxID=2039283 RepID=UPI000EE5B50C|nr:tyrosine-type recombinase/integrase [endosymbiont GvMRE of Glomus versiforme]RHZ37362.1 Tyrosine recombinase XerC [endosymbiont GvMRE of Glomus versiforme]